MHMYATGHCTHFFFNVSLNQNPKARAYTRSHEPLKRGQPFVKVVMMATLAGENENVRNQKFMKEKKLGKREPKPEVVALEKQR